jgi:hypothetical protein
MIDEGDFEEAPQVFGLSVSTEPDPGTLVCLLSFFQILNVVPRSVAAEVRTEQMQQIRIEAGGITAKQVSVIAAKVDQFPTVLTVHWCRV